METLVLWIGFIGAWALFAGPIYQAALELQEQDIEFERIRALGDQIPQPKQISVWWWLVPPVKIIGERRRSRTYRRRYLEALAHEDLESLVTFMNKATGWMFVAVGGLCIAIKETYELTEHNEWSNYILLAIIVAMVLFSLANLIARVKRAQALISKK